MYSEEIKNELLKVRREKSYSCQKLSEMFNVSIQTVYVWVREDKKNSPTKKRDTVIKLFKEGKSPKTLSEEFDTPLMTIYDWLYQSGVELTEEQKNESEKLGRERFTGNLMDTIRKLNEKIKKLEKENKTLKDTNYYLTELLNSKRDNKEETK